MKPAGFEERLAALEKKVADLEAEKKEDHSKDWRRRTVGMFTGDEVMKRIDEEARKYREVDRQKARRKRPTGVRSKSSTD